MGHGVVKNTSLEPNAPAISSFHLYRAVAHIAQSVEHFLGKEEVTGSNPVVGSPNSE
jgi:hypothetical protein